MENKYIFGIRPLFEALESEVKIEKVLLRTNSDSPQINRLKDFLIKKDIPFQFVPVEKLNQMTKGVHQGVAALLPQLDYIEFEEMVENALKSEKNPIFILLDGVSDVRNLGAIARSAECTGVKGIVLPAKGGAAVNSDAVKSSSGALLRIPVAKVSNLRVALYYLKESGFKIVAASEKSENNIYSEDFKGATAIIFGSEDKGISDSILTLADSTVRIPMIGKVGSLNVSVAAGVVLFEAVRQRIS